jgi:transcriptional regulator with XRE-family HTH domain
VGAGVEETFGVLLRRFRLRAGLAQNALARATGINVGTINRLEHGQRLPAGRGQALDLARALQLSRAETNMLLGAAELPAEGFGPLVTTDPVLCDLAALLQDDRLAVSARQEVLAVVAGVVRLARLAGPLVRGEA